MVNTQGAHLVRIDCKTGYMGSSLDGGRLAKVDFNGHLAKVDFNGRAKLMGLKKAHIGKTMDLKSEGEGAWLCVAVRQRALFVLECIK